MKFLHPDKIDERLRAVMEDYERFVLAHWPKARILVHSDWREQPAAGVSVDQHVLGKAVDFHVEGVEPLDAWLGLERFPALTGIGGYPYWKPIPGFHADVRTGEQRARWARDPADKYIGFDFETILLLMNKPLAPDGQKEV